MQAFGLELRKIGNIDSLYKEVDLVLSKVSDSEMQRQTVAHSLNKMIKAQNYFDVCTIKNCAEICQVAISKERLCIYQSIHCMHWNEMMSEYRQRIIAFVLDDFRAVFIAQSQNNGVAHNGTN